MSVCLGGGGGVEGMKGGEGKWRRYLNKGMN